MSPDQVHDLLGPPSQVRHNSGANVVVWSYTHPLKWNYLTIVFSDGKVINAYLDH